MSEINPLIPSTNVYRPRSMHRAVAIILLASGLTMWIGIWVNVLIHGQETTALLMLFPVVYSLLASYFVLRAFTSRVCLTVQSIKAHTPAWTKELPLDKIRGRRRYLSPGNKNSPDIWHLKFEPNDDRFPLIDIEETYNFDDKFYAWFNALPDLDQLDKSRSNTSNFGLV
jgi:hypothetical protein